jgi:methylmalonyl-CoA mutase cobalamin-binding subunit
VLWQHQQVVADDPRCTLQHMCVQRFFWASTLLQASAALFEIAVESQAYSVVVSSSEGSAETAQPETIARPNNRETSFFMELGPMQPAVHGR